MKIVINKRTVFLFPTSLFLNCCTVGIFRRKLKKEGINLTRKQVLLCIKEIKHYKKNHMEWALIEIEEKDGTSGQIMI